MGHVLAGIAWNPEIRNVLALLVGVGVLVGSTYLLLATNVGARLGLLLSLATLFGWIASMGLIWWLYGIGMQGDSAHWRVIEINTGDLTAAQLDEAQSLPEPDQLPDPQTILEGDDELAAAFEPAEGEPEKEPSLGELIEAKPELVDDLGLEDRLGGWNLLVPSDRQRGDAQAAADAALGADGAALFQSAGEYKVLDAYDLGGKERLDTSEAECKPRVVKPKFDGCWDRVKHKLLSIWHWRHPKHYAVVQVQQVIPQETVAGEAPPLPRADESKPVVSVIMIRSLGDKRFPAAMVTIVFTILFALSCWVLHRRDQLVTQNRAAVATT
jgi:hypothetical protein